MSRPLVPRPPSGEPENNILSPNTQKPKKISTACGSCKQRKTRCSGGSPCEACAARGSQCVYDVASDQRRKVAAQRNLLNLAESQILLSRLQQLLGGIIATFRAGDPEAQDVLIDTIRSTVDLSQIAAHVRNARRADLAIEEAFSQVQYVLDSSEELPSPSILLNVSSHPTSSLIDGDTPPRNTFYDPQIDSMSQS